MGRKKSKVAKNAAAHEDVAPWTDKDRKQHAIEMYEKEKNCKVVSFKEFSESGAYARDLALKLQQLSRYGNCEATMMISHPKNDDSSVNKEMVRVTFYTNDHSYHISAHWYDDLESSYLGYTASTRKPRPGETWTRGSDLPDGRYNDETWHRIVCGIVSYEMKNLQI